MSIKVRYNVSLRTITHVCYTIINRNLFPFFFFRKTPIRNRNWQPLLIIPRSRRICKVKIISIIVSVATRKSANLLLYQFIGQQGGHLIASYTHNCRTRLSSKIEQDRSIAELGVNRANREIWIFSFRYGVAKEQGNRDGTPYARRNSENEVRNLANTSYARVILDLAVPVNEHCCHLIV